MSTKNDFHSLLISGSLNINVLYMDKDLIVIDKPVGLVVNESETAKASTLQKILKEQALIDEGSIKGYKQKGDYDKSKEFIDRQGIVHRLDAMTSGNLIIARNLEAFINLQDQFKVRSTVKKYIALSKGFIKDLKVGDEFLVDAPIGRNPKTRHKFAVVEDEGKDAQTEFKLLEIFILDEHIYSLFECKPLTGRTHQIRVHLAAMNVPVVGDKTYSGQRSYAKSLESFTKQDISPRMYLHAFYTKFSHPTTGEVMVITSELPKEFQEILNFLRKKTKAKI